MKNVVLYFLIGLAYTAAAQVPQQINYQGALRNAAGLPLVNQNISVKFELRPGAPGNAPVWQSTESLTTNNLGLFNTQIGKINANDFLQINWNNGPFFLAVYVDTTNSDNHIELGVQQLGSVPYALHALSVPASFTNNVLSIGGNTLAIPAPVTYTAGEGISIISGSVVNTAPDQTVTIDAGSNVELTGSYPSFTIASTPTLEISGNLLSISGGNTVSLPPASEATLVSTGAATTDKLGPNSYSIHVPFPSLTPGNSNITVTGTSPNFVVASSPSLSIAGNVLSISNSNAVTLPQASVVSSGAAQTHTLGANSYSINVPTPVITPGNANITVSSAYPNFVVSSSPQLALNNNSLSISAGNTVTLPAPPTVTATGMATISGGPNYTVSVPLLNFTKTNGMLSSGVNSTAISPSLSLNGSTLSVGQASNNIDLQTISPWLQATGTVTLSNLTNNVAIGRANAALNGGTGRFLTVSGTTAYATSMAALELEGGSLGTNTAVAKIDFNSVGAASHNVARIAAFRAGNVTEGQLTFSTHDGASLKERMRLNDLGYVGIGTGTNSISDHLQLQSAGATNLSVLSATNSSSALLFGTAAQHASGRIDYSNSEKRLSFATNAAQRMVIDSSGKIGVNDVANSLFNFHVNRNIGDFGPGRAAVSGYRFGSNLQAGDGGTGWSYGGVDAAVRGVNNFGNNFSAGVAGINYNDWPNSTAVIGAQWNGSYWGGLAYYDGTRSWGVYTPNNAHIGGGLGIGTALPTASLHVNGNVRIVDGTEGTNKMLVSDAAGNASWRNSAINTSFLTRSNSSQTITSNALTIMNFPAEVHDDGNSFSTNSYVCPSAGVYHFDASVTWSGFVSASNWMIMYIYRNGTSEAQRITATSTGFFSSSISADIKCNANDVITIRVFQLSGSSQTTYGAIGEYTYFSGHKVY